MKHFFYAGGWMCFAILPDRIPTDRYLDYAVIAIAAIEIVYGINQLKKG
jgi:hypothetical protein